MFFVNKYPFVRAVKKQQNIFAETVEIYWFL